MTFASIALIARPISAENFICDVVDLIQDQDCTPPAAPALDLPAADAFLPNNEFSFSWQSVDDPSGVSYKICVAATGTFAGATCSDFISATTYPANSLVSSENQTKFWRVMAVDGAGNESSWSEVRQFTVDVDDPSISFSGSLLLVGGNTPNSDFTGKVSDENLTHYTVVVTDPAGAATTVQSEDASDEATVTYTFNATGLVSGAYLITLTGIDKAGRSAKVEVSVEVDNSGPILTITGGDTIIKGGSITPEVTAEDPREVTTYEWTAHPANPAVLVFDNTVPEPEFAPTAQGSYSFTLTVTDGLGNTTSDDFNFGFASELPQLPLPTDPDQGNDLQSNLPTAVSPTAQTRDPREEADSDTGDDVTQVLGTTSGTPGSSVVPTTVAALTPTPNGWNIWGIMWYWWLAAVAGIAAAMVFIRKFLASRSR